MRSFPSALLALVAASACSAVSAAETHACAGIVDDARRLACYDHAFGKPAPQPAPGATASGAAATPATVAATASPPPQEFGFKRGELERQKSEDEKPPGAADSLSAKVTAVESREGRFTITLDNGQTWSQSETNSRVQLAAGDAVTVRRALLGSYLLTGPQGIATRVRRVR